MPHWLSYGYEKDAWEFYSYLLSFSYGLHINVSFFLYPRKNKNDISKLIFKSGDFQMSPYAEYPKNPRAQDWGRETIEMQENGSTKNLLQMTDVYYMTTNPRNPELERNGLYPPYTGLPGSRHSCIYPGQYNPSFVSDDSRRRDYF
uniref:Uncharacterized protein n=1 Tax=Podarcis muralis TaxID=64176 RepID=A0A670IC62_PODMU